MIEIHITSTANSVDAALEEIADILAAKVKEKLASPNDCISQRQAYKEFGQGNVKRWLRQERLQPVSKRPGKIEYRRSDLLICHQKVQDYFAKN